MKKSLVLVSSIFVLGSGLMRCSSTPAGNDSGPDVLVKKDSAPQDVVQQDVPVVIVTPKGTQLTASNQVQIFGVTEDNQVIYADNGAGAALFAVDANGGTPPVQIAKPTVSSSQTYITAVAGKVVFVWEGVSTATNAAQVGTLHLWKKGGTYVPAMAVDAGGAKSCASAGFASSADGSKVLFTNNSNNTCTQGDVVGANSDGTSPSTLRTGVDLGTDCSPTIGFAGGVNAVTATCTTGPGDGGTPSADIYSYSGTWVGTSILTAALDFWASDTAGDKLFVGTPAQTSVFPIGGGSAFNIDTKNVKDGFTYMTKDGNHVVYSTTAGDLYRAATATAASPVTLQATGVKVVRSYSADEAHLIFTTNFDTQQFGGDLFLASMTATGTPVTLDSAITGALFGVRFTDDFTTDSAYALFIQNLNSSQGIGDLYAIPTAGGTAAQITTAEWINFSATGSKIVYNDNCQNCSGTSASAGGTADIKVVDATTPTTSTLIQAGADVNIMPSFPRDRIIYTYSANPPADDGGVIASGNGLYSVAIP